MRATKGAGGPPARRIGRFAAVLLVLLSAASPAAAKTDDELRKERADVLAKKAQVASQVDVLKDDDAKVSASLDAISENVGAQSAAMKKADAAAQRARLAAEQARAAEATALVSVRAAEESLRRAAVLTYTAGQGKGMQVESDDINAISRAQAYGALATGRQTDALDKLEGPARTWPGPPASERPPPGRPSGSWPTPRCAWPP